MGSPMASRCSRTNRSTNAGASQAASGTLLAPLENSSSTAPIANQNQECDFDRLGRSAARGNSPACVSLYATDVCMLHSCFCPLARCCHQAVNGVVDDLLDHLLFPHPGESRPLDEQGSNPVDRRPQGLACGLDVHRAKTFFVHAAPHHVSHRAESWMRAVRTLQHRRPQKKSKAVVVWVAQPEFHVGAHALLEGLRWIFLRMTVLDPVQRLQQPLETLFHQGLKQFFLVFEVEVDAARRVFNLFRQLAHGKAFIPLARQYLPGRIENDTAEFLLVLFAPDAGFHNEQCSVY